MEMLLGISKYSVYVQTIYDLSPSQLSKVSIPLKYYLASFKYEERAHCIGSMLFLKREKNGLEYMSNNIKLFMN